MRLQDRPDLFRALRQQRSVHSPTADGGRRPGEPALRLAAAVRARHRHARPAGLARRGRCRAGAEAGVDEETIRSATTPTRIPAATPGAWTTRRSPISATRSSSRLASGMSACTRPVRAASTVNSPICADFVDATMSASAKDWPQLNFIIYHGAYLQSAAIRKWRCRNSSDRPHLLGQRLADIPGSTTSRTSMPMSASSSPRP